VEEDGVELRDHRRRRADADGQRGDGDDGEAARVSQLTPGVSQVGEHVSPTSKILPGSVVQSGAFPCATPW
jgi:hypothetical protein